VKSFQFSSYEDAHVNRRLAIHLELAEGVTLDGLGVGDEALPEIFYRGLAKANQDFREVTRMFGVSALEVPLHLHGTGPFEGADVRLKSQYIKPTN
jgi:phenylacetate-CoA ligase